MKSKTKKLENPYASLVVRCFSLFSLSSLMFSKHFEASGCRCGLMWSPALPQLAMLAAVSCIRVGLAA